jgi:hypothetical protein
VPAIVHIPRYDKAAEYRRRATEARAAAQQISLREARAQLHSMAEHYEALAEAEEHEARKVAPIRMPKPEAGSRQEPHDPEGHAQPAADAWLRRRDP